MDNLIVPLGNSMFKILLIDDDQDILEFIKKPLQHLGFTVDATDNVDSAISLFKSSAYDLIITDLILPQSSGVDAIRMFKEINSKIKIIAISGGGKFNPESADSITNLDAAKNAGADITMTKPFDTTNFIEQLVYLIAA